MRKKRGHGTACNTFKDVEMRKRQKRNPEKKEKKKRACDIPMFPTVLFPSNDTDESFPRSNHHPRKSGVSQEIKPAIELNEFKHTKCYLKVSDLDVGSVILGVIAEYDETAQEFEVHLPFHLRGFLSLSHTMEPQTECQESFMRDFYSPGVRVVCVVISQASRRILLSLRPSIINAGFSFSFFQEGMWLPASITSYEEFGYTANFGVEENVTVYISKSSSQTHEKKDSNKMCHYFSSLRPGCVVYVGITHIDMNQRSVYCSLEATSHKLNLETSLDFSLVRAGLLVEAQVLQVLSPGTTKEAPPIGVMVKFCRTLKGIVPVLHARRSLSSSSEDSFTSQQWKPGFILSVRILFVNFTKKRFFLSPVKNLVHWTQNIESIPKLCIGSRISNLQVISVDPYYGARLLFHVERQSVVADVANEQCYDNRRKVLNNSADGHQQIVINQHIPEAKIVSLNMFERSYIVVTAPSLLNESLLLPQDLLPGQVVKGVVQNISKRFVFVRLSAFLTGLLLREHVTDLPLTELPRFVQLNQPIDVCVYSICRNTVWLTAKKALLALARHSPKTHFLHYFSLNQIITGVVGKILEGNTMALIHFFHGVKGFLPVEEFKQFKKEHRCQTGAVVQCRVVNPNIFTDLRLSLDLGCKTTPPHFLNPLVEECFTVTQALTPLANFFPRGFTRPKLLEFLQTQALVRFQSNPDPCDKNPESFFLYKFLPWKYFQNSLRAGNVYFELLAVLGVKQQCLVVLFSLRPDMTRTWCALETNKKRRFSMENIKALEPFPIGVGILPFSHVDDTLTFEETIKNSSELSEESKRQLTHLDRIVIVDSHLNLNRFQKIQDLNKSHFRTIDSVEPSQNIRGVFISAKPSLVHVALEQKFIRNTTQLHEVILDWIPGFIYRRLKECLVVCLGSLRILGVTSTDKGLHPDHFRLGQTVWVRIQNLTLTDRKYMFECDILPWSTHKPEKESMPSTSVSVGDLCEAKVLKITPETILVQLLPMLTHANLPFTELPESPIDTSLCVCLYPPDRHLSSVRVIDIQENIVVSFKPCLTRELYQIHDIVVGYVKFRVRNGLLLQVHLCGYTHPYFQRTAFCHVRDIENIQFPKGKKNPGTQQKKLHQILFKYPIGFLIKAQIKGYKNDSKRTLCVSLLPSNYRLC